MTERRGRRRESVGKEAGEIGAEIGNGSCVRLGRSVVSSVAEICLRLLSTRIGAREHVAAAAGAAAVRSSPSVVLSHLLHVTLRRPRPRRRGETVVARAVAAGCGQGLHTYVTSLAAQQQQQQPLAAFDDLSSAPHH